MPDVAGRDEPVGVGPGSASPSGAEQGLTRHDFLLSLGVGTAACIAGHFLLPHASSPPPDADRASLPSQPLPSLRADVAFGREDGLLTVSRADAASPAVCAVNGPGEAVLQRLDGRHTLAAMAEAVAAQARIPRSEVIEARVAYFVAQLGMLGFLAEPFHVFIAEGRETA